MPMPEQNPPIAENEMSVEEFFEQIEKATSKRTSGSVRGKPLPSHPLEPSECERLFRLNPLFGS